MADKFALVLGAGGIVGMAYHAGVLRALDEVGGVDPRQASVVIGTSAGAMVGAQVRLGRSADELWDMVMGVHPLTSVRPDEGRAGVFERAWTTPVELARRTLGSAFILTRSATRVPMPPLPAVLRRAFPGGFFTIPDAENRLRGLFPDEWPEAPLWLCAVDVESGRRVVLGRSQRSRAETSLARAVLASCAIPGVYQPVRAGGRTLVDGGVHSTTNLDLLLKRPPALAICVAPMGWDPRRRPDARRRLGRRPAMAALGREVPRLRAAGTDVLLIRPGGDELRVHGFDAMRPAGNEAVTQAAYEATARLLETERARRLLAGHAA
jgi:NTE family protein